MSKPSHLVLAMLAVAIAHSCPFRCQAQYPFPAEKELQDAPASLEAGIKALGGNGAQFQFVYSGEAFANLSGGVEQGGDYDGLINLSLRLDLQKLFQWNGATLYANMLYPHGNGISARYVHDYNILSSIDAYDSPRLSELWLQQTLFGGSFSIRAGELVTDNDFCISTNSALFINSSFGPVGTLLHNVIGPLYPVASEGVRLHVDINPSFYLQALAIDDNPGIQSGDDKSGARFGFERSHGVLSFIEAGYTPATQGLQADYKLGGYYDSQFHPDISNGASAHGDYAFYAVVDQPLYAAPGSTKDAPLGLGAYVRASYAPDERNAVVYNFDTGFNYTGLFPGRPGDVLGAAFSFERLGMDIEPASGAPVLSHHEHVVELTYLANLSPWFSLQPDLQYIINPGGIGRTPNAFVAGMRFNVTF